MIMPPIHLKDFVDVSFRGAPHWEQKLAVDLFSLLHLGQRKTSLSKQCLLPYLVEKKYRKWTTPCKWAISNPVHNPRE
jgi:hypothetical protein